MYSVKKSWYVNCNLLIRHYALLSIHFKLISVQQLSKLTHDLVTTLDFGFILVATSDNIVTTVSESLLRCIFGVGFPTWYYVAATQRSAISKDLQYCLAITCFDKEKLFCICQCEVLAQIMDIWKLEDRCLNREKGFLILCSSLFKNSSLFCSGKFGRVLV